MKINIGSWECSLQKKNDAEDGIRPLRPTTCELAFSWSLIKKFKQIN
jgi:hypothetical protein